MGVYVCMYIFICMYMRIYLYVYGVSVSLKCFYQGTLWGGTRYHYLKPGWVNVPVPYGLSLDLHHYIVPLPALSTLVVQVS